jgi:hypothetical protein
VVSFKTTGFCLEGLKDNQKNLREIGVSCEIPTTYHLNSRSMALPFNPSCWVIIIIVFVVTIELHLSGLMGTASHPDMQKIRIIGFFLKIVNK